VKFSDRLIAAIERRGIKKQDLATMVGVSNGTISNYINGDRTPDLDGISKLADALQVSAAELAGFSSMDTAFEVVSASVAAARSFAENPDQVKEIFARILKHSQALQLSLMDARKNIEKADGEFFLLYKTLSDMGVKPISSEKTSDISGSVARGLSSRKEKV
jgi:transcriptional regulator with XRE-family HTH domain